MTVALWIVPALPLAGFLLCLLLGTRLGKGFVSAAGVGSIGIATLAAWSRLLPYFRDGGGAVVERIAPWITAGNFSVDVSFRLDPLSALMVSFVTFVGFLIHLYSVGYMKHDETDAGYARYFAYMNLFMFSMLTLVLADNFVLMFVGWEGVGLCSYLLIGYYIDRKEAGDAAKKAFITNRVGDWGFVLGIMLTFFMTGSVSFFANPAAGETARTALSFFKTAPVDPFTAGAIFDGGATSIAVLLFIVAEGNIAKL